MVRLGLSTLFNYDGEGVFPLIWSQGLGCFIMGVLVIRKMEVERLGGAGLYIGLGTGANDRECGCLLAPELKITRIRPLWIHHDVLNMDARHI